MTNEYEYACEGVSHENLIKYSIVFLWNVFMWLKSSTSFCCVLEVWTLNMARYHTCIFHFSFVISWILMKNKPCTLITSFREMLSSVVVVLLSSPLFAIITVVFFPPIFPPKNYQSFKCFIRVFIRSYFWLLLEYSMPKFVVASCVQHVAKGKSIFHLSFVRCS